MLVLRANITIGDLVFAYANHVDIKSSWNLLTDTGSITLPRTLSLDGVELKSLIKVGDSVAISLGYNGDIWPVFTGYVTRLSADIPFSVSVEDEMWKLKRAKPVSASWRSISLQEMLAAVLPAGTQYQAVDMSLGQFRVSNATPSQVLQGLREYYQLFSYFQDGILKVGFAYSQTSGSHHELHMQKHVVNNNLEYRLAGDVKLLVRATAVSPSGAQTTVEVGDPDGELRSLHYYDVSGDDLKRLAESEITRLSGEGYKGSLVTFGQPQVKHGDTIELKDDLYPERTGTYFVDEVGTSFGLGGYRQRIKLGAKA